jgi:hypothetical protein
MPYLEDFFGAYFLPVALISFVDGALMIGLSWPLINATEILLPYLPLRGLMKAKAFKQLATWRAIFAALALLFTGLSPAISLSASEPEFCEMACCVSEGHCCCASRKPWVKGQKPDGHPIIEPFEIRSKSCYSCAPPSSSNFISRDIARPSASAFNLAQPRDYGYHAPLRAHHSIWFTPTPPRAPPALLI